jgi:hypothetical protein
VVYMSLSVRLVTERKQSTQRSGLTATEHRMAPNAFGFGSAVRAASHAYSRIDSWHSGPVRAFAYRSNANGSAVRCGVHSSATGSAKGGAALCRFSAVPIQRIQMDSRT